MYNYPEICETLKSSNSLGESLFNIYTSNLSNELFSTPDRENQLKITRGEFSNKVLSLSTFLKDVGVSKGDKVAILSNTRAEWLIADLAILSLGAISVSVYQSLLPSEIAFILSDSDCKFIFIENQEQLDKLEEILKRSWEIPAVEDRPKTEVKIELHSIISFEQIFKHSINVVDFQSIFLKYPPDQNSVNKTVSKNDLASIVYTSGTTGPPKGVMQTHGNHLANIRQVLESGLMLKYGAIFLFLPLAHSFARLMGYVSIYSNLSLKFPEVIDHKTSKADTALLARNLRESETEIIPVVPRLLEKIKSQIETQSAQSSFASFILRTTLKYADINYNKPNVFSKLGFLITTPIRKKITKKIFGANFRYCVSGGAKLPVSVHLFFDSLGILILQGYGLTETCVATNVCRPEKNKIGSVGPVLSSDIEVKIASDQEIIIRGPNVAIGYLNRPQATNEAWNSEKWFLTGDLGHVDKDGFLFITGRKKELIVTSGGKKISPGAIEEKILQYNVFSQAILIGNDQKFCSVIVTLNEGNVCSELQIEKTDLQSQKEKIDALVDSYRTKINNDLASFESIKKVIISPFEFTQENGLLTPSLKIKRNEVEKRFKTEIDQIYASN